MPVIAAEQSSFGSLPILLVIAVLFGGLIYMQVRARKKVAAQQAAMVSGLEVGSRVVMISGLKGMVVEVGKDEVQVEIAPGVVSTFVTKAIGNIEKPESNIDHAPGDDIIRSEESDPESPIEDN